LLPVSTAADLPSAFVAASNESANAMLVLAGTLFTTNRSSILQLAIEHRIPTLYPSRLFVDDGGLMDYAYLEAERGSSAAQYVFDILHGADPADLPMAPPPDIELVFNRSAADAIGYSMPTSVLATATDVLP
jgi:putative tryptophan/tyrosine transport system substrate-binding protein